MSEQGNRSLQHFSGLDRNMLESSVRESAVTLTENGYAWDMISDKQLLKTNIEKEMIVTPGAAYKPFLFRRRNIFLMKQWKTDGFG